MRDRKGLFCITNFSKFDEHILQLTGGTVNMGVIDVVKRQERQQGAERKSYEVVQNLILDFGFSDEQAAKAAEVSLDFVRKVRSVLEKKK